MRQTRPSARGALAKCVVGAALLVCGMQAQAFVYDPFPDAASIKPSDELEERIWQESDTFRSQFVHGQPSGAVAALQDKVREMLGSQWPELAPHLNLFVIDNADVLALSSANGDIILSTGMLMRLDSEEEVRVVLAREIAHVVNRHAVRSVYAARLGAGANVVFQTMVKANSLVGTVGLLSSFQVSPEMLIADGGKAYIQAQLGKVKDNMADNFMRSMSATGFDAMVKTSLFGYSDSLERESDELALQQVGPGPYLRVMQRLLDEANADEKKFSAFYANADRLEARIDQGKRFAQSGNVPGRPAAATADNGLAADTRGSASKTPPSLVALPPDTIELPASEPVASVVVGGENDVAEQTGALHAPVLLSTASTWGQRPYGDLLSDIALSVFQSELELGHVNRAMLDMDRTREGVRVPPAYKLVLAQACWTQGDAARRTRAQQLLEEHLKQAPDDAGAWKLLGVMSLEQGQDEAARSQLEKAREKASTDDERGFIEQHLRRLDKKKASAS